MKHAYITPLNIYPTMNCISDKFTWGNIWQLFGWVKQAKNLPASGKIDPRSELGRFSLHAAGFLHV